MNSRNIPYDNLKTIFLDAGNTLLSMDYAWIKDELLGMGIQCNVNELKRAEAAARPLLSSALEKLKSTENKKTSVFYMGSMLKKLPATSQLPENELIKIIEALLQNLQSPGWTKRFWSNLIPGAQDALEILKDNGLRLTVVSNSNGIIEEIMSDLGIRTYFNKIIDSHYVGFEKPDQRLFKHALDISGADPAYTLHIGDLYHVDVIGAWSAGVHALLLDPYGDWADVDCTRMPDVFSFARMMAEYKKV
jgi:HAD superfamily hydrolase (TIGR01509 family)